MHLFIHSFLLLDFFIFLRASKYEDFNVCEMTHAKSIYVMFFDKMWNRSKHT